MGISRVDGTLEVQVADHERVLRRISSGGVLALFELG